MSRPEDCQCFPWQTENGLPCWPCYRAGFRKPNPSPPTDEAEELEKQAEHEQRTLAEAQAVAGGAK